MNIYNWPNPWEGYLHITLLSFQSVEELRRKADKAKRKGFCTQEETDLNRSEGVRNDRH
jgi:hypothetical protein